jgi:hypothetical protein
VNTQDIYFQAAPPVTKAGASHRAGISGTCRRNRHPALLQEASRGRTIDLSPMRWQAIGIAGTRRSTSLTLVVLSQFLTDVGER